AAPEASATESNHPRLPSPSQLAKAGPFCMASREKEFCAIFRQLMPVFTNIAAYKFASLGDLKELQAALRTMCGEAGMRGTILLSPEGINVVVAAEPDAA